MPRARGPRRLASPTWTWRSFRRAPAGSGASWQRQAPGRRSPREGPARQGGPEAAGLPPPGSPVSPQHLVATAEGCGQCNVFGPSPDHSREGLLTQISERTPPICASPLPESVCAAPPLRERPQCTPCGRGMGSQGLFLDLTGLQERGLSFHGVSSHVAGESQAPALHVPENESFSAGQGVGKRQPQNCSLRLPQRPCFSLFTHSVKGIYFTTHKKDWPQQTVTLSGSLALVQGGHIQLRGWEVATAGAQPASRRGTCTRASQPLGCMPGLRRSVCHARESVRSPLGPWLCFLSQQKTKMRLGDPRTPHKQSHEE